jgi:hypothetical protein
MTEKTKTDAGAGELQSVMKVVAGVGAVESVLALVTYGAHAAFSVATGALIAVSNLWVLGKIIASLMPKDSDANADADARADADGEADAKADADARANGGGGARGAWTAFAFVKILLLFGGIWLLMSKGIVSPMGLAVGYGSLFIGIALSTMLTSMRPRSRR